MADQRDLDPRHFSTSQAWHLARSADEVRLTDFEFALMAASSGFERYTVQTARLVGEPELGYNEVVIINVVRMHDKPKDAATIARLLNRDDLPNVQYALRKLVSTGLIEKSKLGTATVFTTTDEGVRWTNRYAALRSRVLLELLTEEEAFVNRIDSAARVTAVLAGMFDSAARAASLINPRVLFTDDD